MADRTNLILGIVMLVLGILAVMNRIGFLGEVAGVILVVVGVLMIIKKLPGGHILGAAAIVLGALLIIPNELAGALKPVFEIIDIIIGVLLIVFGVLKIMGR